MESSKGTVNRGTLNFLALHSSSILKKREGSFKEPSKGTPRFSWSLCFRVPVKELLSVYHNLGFRQGFYKGLGLRN